MSECSWLKWLQTGECQGFYVFAIGSRGPWGRDPARCDIFSVSRGLDQVGGGIALNPSRNFP